MDQSLSVAKTVADTVANTVTDTVGGTFSDFINFLTQKNMINLMIAFILGNYINDFANNFVDIVAIPIVNKVTGEKHKELQDHTIVLFGIEFKIGKLLYLFIKFIIIAFIIYIFFVVMPRKINKSLNIVTN